MPETKYEYYAALAERTARQLTDSLENWTAFLDTAARLYKINASDAVTSYVLDTPGIRSFHLWDVIPEEVAGFYRDIRPFVSQCQFDDCTHTHETGCAVKAAVGNGLIDARRYESYCQIFAGELEEEEEELGNRQ